MIFITRERGKKKMKRMLAMLLAMAMLLVVFAGCGKNDSTKSELHPIC